MSMDRNSLLAIVSCVVLFMAYQTYMAEKYPHLQNPTKKTESTPQPSHAEKVEKTGNSVTATEVPEAAPVGYNQLSNAELKFETENAVYIFNQEFSALEKVLLKNYQLSQDADEGFVNLLDGPLKIQAITDLRKVAGTSGFQARREGNSITFEKQTPDWRVSQKFEIPKTGYSIQISTSYENVSSGSLELDAGLLLQENVKLDDSGGFGPAAFVAQRKTFVLGIDGGREMEDAVSFCEDDANSLDDFKVSNTSIDFAGIDLHYFLKVIKSEAGKMSLFMEKTRRTTGDICPISLVAYQPMGIVKSGEKIQMAFQAYLGPKDVDVLANHDSAFAQLIDFNMIGINLSILAKPLLSTIKFFYSWTHNYGIAIILLTICLKILFYPLTKSAAVSMKRMQKLQPEMSKIKEKYKSDPAKQQQQLMKFMSVNKANPMKGCLPILPQMPVFISFYSVLSQSIELRHAELVGWISDLSAADPYYILPLLLGALMFVQQKVTPTASMDPNQQKIMMMMPLLFTVFMLGLPSGLVLYMIVNTVVSIVQQQWLNRKLDNLDFKVVRV